MRIEPSTDPLRWDDFVRRQSNWTAFHLSSWARVVERSFGHRYELLEARSGEAITGVLPLATVTSRTFGRFLVSVPYASYGGPLGSDDATARLRRHAIELAERRSADVLELRGGAPDTLDGALAGSDEWITVVMPLPGDPGELWDGLKPKVRNQVRLARKNGYTVRFGGDQLAAFWDVLARNMRDLGVPVLPRRFFEVLLEELGDDVDFACVRVGGTPVAGGCTISWADRTEITWGSSLRSHNPKAPNMLLYWSLLERASEGGRRTFSFGRCAPGDGVHRFKRQWGGADVPLHWVRSASGAASVASAARRFWWARSLWTRLPVPVANAIGPTIRRRLP